MDHSFTIHDQHIIHDHYYCETYCDNMSIINHVINETSDCTYGLLIFIDSDNTIDLFSSNITASTYGVNIFSNKMIYFNKILPLFFYNYFSHCLTKPIIKLLHKMISNTSMPFSNILFIPINC